MALSKAPPILTKGGSGIQGKKEIAKATGCEVTLLNDADVAGVAEMMYGAGKDQNGAVMIFTLGTGVGSVMFMDGKLVPNLELGHMYLRNMDYDAEDHMSSRVRDEEDPKLESVGCATQYLFSTH